MPEPRDIVDIRGVETPTTRPVHCSGPSSPPAPRRGRPWLAVQWRCCGTYSRVYRNAAGDAYEGRCPRCGRSVRARVGAEGVSTRFFEAG